MSRKLKLGVISFVLVDIILAVSIVSLYQLQVHREISAQLSEAGFTLYPQARDVSAFSLTNEHGAAFTRADLMGRWNFLFFGYTSCPDICPLTMAELKQFYAGLTAPEQNRAQIIMVSVDPAKDDTATLAEYVDSFDKDFVGLTGNYRVIEDLASQFFVAHIKSTPPGPSTVSPATTISHNNHSTAAWESDYLIEHSGHLAVVDPDGNFIAVMRSPVRDQDITRAFRTLLTEF